MKWFITKNGMPTNLVFVLLVVATAYTAVWGL